MGEMIALRWTDVDLSRSRITLRQNDWHGVLDTPKGGRAGIVDLCRRLGDGLAAHQARSRLLADDGRVLCREDGRPLTARIVPAREAPAERGFWRVLNRKYYVDELYDAAIVQPLVFSRSVLWRGVDNGVIDSGAVNGVANLFRALGWLGSRLQSGQVGVYVVLFLVGAVYVLGMMAWR